MNEVPFGFRGVRELGGGPVALERGALLPTCGLEFGIFFRVQGSGFRVQGLEFRVQGLPAFVAAIRNESGRRPVEWG